jgi:AcrR family transcriptional regulator
MWIMPRPRTTSDEAILEAADRVIAREGPVTLTLAVVAAEAGLAAPTLVQRFGSKRGLLLAVARRAPAAVLGHFDAARERGASSVDALLDALAAVAGPESTPEAVSNLLAFQQMEMQDPEFHALALEGARAMREEIAALLEDALAAGELARCDPDDLARTVQTAYNGALLTWALFREGTLDGWLRGEIEEVIAPYTPAA